MPPDNPLRRSQVPLKLGLISQKEARGASFKPVSKSALLFKLGYDRALIAIFSHSLVTSVAC